MKTSKETQTKITLTAKDLFADRLRRCTDCICLSSDEEGDWFCDEAEQKCLHIKRCPEGMDE